MNYTRLATSFLATSLVLVPACSGDDEDGSGGTGGGTDGTSSATASDTGPTTTTTDSTSDASTDPTPGTSTTDSGSGTSGPTTDATTTDATTTDATTTDSGGTAGACTSWVVTYDLDGSVFAIDASVDFQIDVEMPYDDDLNMGPGTMKIRFTDDSGAPGNGGAQIVDYALTQNFVTGSLGTNVTTDLETSSGPEACGTATGAFDGSKITWNPDSMDPLCQDGSVSCAGTFCGLQGAPPADAPIEFMNDCSGALTLNDFEFTSGTDAFTMAATVVSMDGSQTTTLAFVGTATSTDEDMATPACACG